MNGDVSGVRSVNLSQVGPQGRHPYILVCSVQRGRGCQELTSSLAALRSFDFAASPLTTLRYLATRNPRPHESPNMFRVTRVLRADVAASASKAIKKSGTGRDAVLKRGAKRDPELYVCPLTRRQAMSEPDTDGLWYRFC